MPPDEPAVTGAPLRFGERAKVAESEHDGEPPAFGPEPAMPAGPPPLREASHEPVRNGHDDTASVPTTTVGTTDEGQDDDGAKAEAKANAKDKAKNKDEDTRTGTPRGNDARPAPRVITPDTPASQITAADLAGMKRRQRKQLAKRRARKVKRIVRRLDAWSVLKVAFIFNLCAYIVAMVAGVVLWRVADSAGVIENVESFIEDLGAFETYRFEPDLIFEAYALGGAVLAVLSTGLIALGAVLFNLISDLVGGIRMTVIEEPGSLPARRRKSGGKRSEASGTVSRP